MDSGLKKMNESFRKQEENLKRHHETFMKKMDHSFNSLDETLDSTLEGIKAVSYTHLDVYKRQVYQVPISHNTS